MAEPHENTADNQKPESQQSDSTAPQEPKTENSAGAGEKPQTSITSQPKAKAAAASTGVKPAPSKPASRPTAKGGAKKGSSRRFFLFSMFGSWFAIAWTSFTASMIGMTLGTIRFLFPNVLSEPPSSFKAGHVNSYEENVVNDRFKEQGSWVIRARDERDRDTIYALSTTCTHLGCTPNWLENDKKFKCPCHGSGFKISGVNFEGPAPRPLERYAISRTDDNQVLVDKARKFQKELGQWTDPDSFILLG